MLQGAVKVGAEAEGTGLPEEEVVLEDLALLLPPFPAAVGEGVAEEIGGELEGDHGLHGLGGHRAFFPFFMARSADSSLASV